jgi:hypothetical protein
MSRKIILFELNEVPWRVLDDYARDNPHGPLARLLAQASLLETTAHDTSLSPWITWPTVHRGVTDEDHTISDFNQDLSEIDRAYPPLWQLLARRGVPTGVFGSLHSYPLPADAADYCFYVPDVFAAGSECFPQRLELFQSFNLSMSRESARNVSARVPWSQAARFLAAAPGLGLKPRTLLDLGLQLLDERRRNWVKARRRTYQVRLAFDLFLRQLERTQPAFCTFFTNHVASSMHRYWAARYPGDYQQFEYDPSWVGTYCHEIDWTMRQCERMVARLLKFIQRRPEYNLWIATSMGQAATEASIVHTQMYLKNVDRFLARLGLARGDWQTRPAMLPRVILQVAAEQCTRFERGLQSITIPGRGPLPWKQLSPGVYRIHPGALQNLTDEPFLVDGRPVPLAELGFVNEPIQDAAGSNAYHVPGGALAVFDPRAASTAPRRQQIDTHEIAPLILRALDVAPPAHWRRSRAA